MADQYPSHQPPAPTFPPAFPLGPSAIPPAPPPRKSPVGKILLIVGIVSGVVAIGCVIGAIALVSRYATNSASGGLLPSRDEPESDSAGSSNVESAQIGDCVTGVSRGEGIQSAAGIKIVNCDDAGASHKVIGTVDGKSYAYFQATEVEVMCQPYPTTSYAVFLGAAGADGQILCLEDAK